MKRINDFPEVDNLNIHYAQKPAQTILTGNYLDARGFRHDFIKHYAPSLFFGILKDHNGWPVFPGYLVLLPLFFISVSTLFLLIRFFNLSIPLISLLSGCISISSFILLFLLLLFLGDVFLSHHTIAIIRENIDQSFFKSEIWSNIFLSISLVNWIVIIYFTVGKKCFIR